MSTYPRIEINGVAMDDDTRWAMDPIQALRSLAGRRLTSVVVPGRSGVLHPDNDAFDVGAFSVSLTVMGTGSTMDLRVASLDANLGHLSFLFSQPNIQVTYYASATQVYQASCRLVTASQPEQIGLDNAKVTYVLDIPETFWRSPGLVQWRNSLTLVGNTQHVVTTLDGSTAPITDSVIFVGGPFTYVTIFDAQSQQRLTYPATCPSGNFIRFDMKAYTATQISAVSLGALGTDRSNLVINSGPNSERSWLTLNPYANGGDITDRKVRLDLGTTGSSGVTSLWVYARKAF